MSRARSQETEWMDDPRVPPDVMERVLGEIDAINRWLGGWAASRALLRRHLRRLTPRAIRLLDVGAGSGRGASELAGEAQARGFSVSTFALDLHPSVCRVAARRGPPDFGIVRGDAFRLPFRDDSFDFVHAALFLHHFSAEEIPSLLTEMQRVAKEGVLINDLVRSGAAERLISWITRLVGASDVVQHDAPASVRRGFARADLEGWRSVPGLSHLSFRMRVPFRWVISSDSEGASRAVS